MLDFDKINITYDDGIFCVAQSQALNNSQTQANQKQANQTQPAIKSLVAGVDEAGRGPLLGPVAVSAVILDPLNPITGLNDSKKLSEKKRQALFLEIVEKALSYSIIFVSADKIDDINILQATLLGMQQSVMHLPITPEHVLIDGNKTVDLPMPCDAIVGGDALHPQISAASILAKVARDDYVTTLAKKYPAYGIDKHKGYPTKLHKQMLAQHGILPEHRKSFKPILLMLEGLEN